MSINRKLFVLSLSIVLVWCYSAVDLMACPSCADNVAAVSDDTAKGFAVSILGLIAIPLMFVGGIILSLVRADRKGVGMYALIPLLVAAIGMTGCGGSGDDDSNDAAQRIPADMSKAVEVSGTILFEGEPPPQELIDVSADDYCGVRHDGGTIASNEVIINDGKLANVFVYISSGLEGYSFQTNTSPVTLDQKGCRYYPHVMGVMIGQPIDIRNSDSTIHNVHAMTKKNKAFNLGQRTGARDTKTFDKEEVMIPVVCDVHGWMKSWIGVLHHPAFAVSGENGSYTFTAPLGEYTVTAWHERFGTKEEQIVVEEGQPVSLNFSFQ